MAEVSMREVAIMTPAIFAIGARIVCRDCFCTHGCVKGNLIKSCDNCKEIEGGWKCVPNAVASFEIYQSCGCEKKRNQQCE